MSSSRCTYWCYHCEQTVQIPMGGSLCPNCGEGFIEEFTSPHPSEPLHPPAWSGGLQSSEHNEEVDNNNNDDNDDDEEEDEEEERRSARNQVASLSSAAVSAQSNNPAINRLFEALSSLFLQAPPGAFMRGGGGGGFVVGGSGEEEEGGGGGGGSGSGRRSRRFAMDDAASELANPMLLLQRHLQSVLDDSNVEVFFDSGEGPRPLPSNFGDYFLGPHLDQLVQQLVDSDPNRYGSPPAAKSVVESIPNITVGEKALSAEMSQCAVCMEEFELGAEVKQLPCDHIYHPDCISPWLADHSSCPVCRHQLPTDDPDYNEAHGLPRSSAQAISLEKQQYSHSEGSNEGATSSENAPHSSGSTSRSFSMPFRWPFRSTPSQSSSQSHQSGAIDDDNNDNGDDEYGRSSSGVARYDRDGES